MYSGNNHLYNNEDNDNGIAHNMEDFGNRRQSSGQELGGGSYIGQSQKYLDGKQDSGNNYPYHGLG